MRRQRRQDKPSQVKTRQDKTRQLITIDKSANYTKYKYKYKYKYTYT